MARYQWPERESYKHYVFGFRRKRSGAWELAVAYVNDNWHNHYVKREQFPVEEGRWYNLRMTLAKDHIEAYLDNKLIAEWDDKSLASGKVGLRGYNMEARFDNVVITGDDIPDVGPSGCTTVEPRGHAVEPTGKSATKPSGTHHV